MSRKSKVAIGVGLALAVGLVWLAVPPSGAGGTAGVGHGIVAPAYAGVHGHHRFAGGHGMRRFCSEARSEKVEHVIEFVDAFMTFSADQQAAWSGMVAALHSGDEIVDARCETLKELDVPGTALDRLTRARTMLATGVEVMDVVAPAFEQFYATLDAEQQAAIDNLVSWRGLRGHRRTMRQ